MILSVVIYDMQEAVFRNGNWSNMDTNVKNRELNMVIPNSALLMSDERFKIWGDEELEFKTVFVPPVHHTIVPPDFGFDEYIKNVVRGVQSREKHEEFLNIVYAPYDRDGKIANGFWWGDDTDERPKNLIETYSKRFTECFGEKGRNLVSAPFAVREIIESIFVNGKSYSDYYNIHQINKMNFLEMVCYVIDNISRGEIAKSFSKYSEKQMVAAFRPVGKRYVNIYLPVSAFADFGRKQKLPDR